MARIAGTNIPLNTEKDVPVKVEDLKEQMITENNKIAWVPAAAEA